MRPAKIVFVRQKTLCTSCSYALMRRPSLESLPQTEFNRYHTWFTVYRFRIRSVINSAISATIQQKSHLSVWFTVYKFTVYRYRIQEV